MLQRLESIQYMTPSEEPKSSAQNPFDSPELAARYESWYSGPGRRADVLEKCVLKKLLRRLDGRTILEIGCGTGHFTRWLRTIGFEVTGLDSSAAMLEQARSHKGDEYICGNALALPFGDRSFDIAAMITTLEFVGAPRTALREAFRISRSGLLLGVINRQSLLARKYCRSGNPLWNSAEFFSPRELEEMIRMVAGQRLESIHWRTTLWPLPLVRDLRLPWGGFIGLAARWTPT